MSFSERWITAYFGTSAGQARFPETPGCDEPFRFSSVFYVSQVLNTVSVFSDLLGPLPGLTFSVVGNLLVSLIRGEPPVFIALLLVILSVLRLARLLRE